MSGWVGLWRSGSHPDQKGTNLVRHESAIVQAAASAAVNMLTQHISSIMSKGLICIDVNVDLDW